MNTFLDCGYFEGHTTKRYLDSGLIDDSWDIFAFDPNPDLTINVVPDMKVIPQAMWLKNGHVKLEISGRRDSASISGTTGHTNPRVLEVVSLNFPRFISLLPDGFIICSMDIEGAEFRILEAMLANDSIDRIGLLDIEFHHRFMNFYTPDHALDLLNRIMARGVAVRLKVGIE